MRRRTHIDEDDDGWFLIHKPLALCILFYFSAKIVCLLKDAWGFNLNVYRSMFIMMAVCKRCICISLIQQGKEICFSVCVCIAEKHFESFLSSFITMQDYTTWCDSAQCSSASGTGILIDVKTTKYLKQWWVVCIENRIPLKQNSPRENFTDSTDGNWASLFRAQCEFNWKILPSSDCYIFVVYNIYIFTLSEKITCILLRMASNADFFKA